MEQLITEERQQRLMEMAEEDHAAKMHEYREGERYREIYLKRDTFTKALLVTEIVVLAALTVVVALK